MDDPAVDPELDSFSLTFPLPYRIGFIVTAAIWGWAFNLHYLHHLTIDVPSLIRYPQRPSTHHPPHHASTYRLATALTALFAVSITTFWLFSHRNPSLVLYYDWLPMIYLVLLAAIFALPLRSLSLSHSGRSRVLSTLKRVSIGGLAQAQDGKFGDVLLADVLTSYAKVFGDLFVCLCMFFHANGSATDRPDRHCGGTVVVPLIMAVPSLIRLRQCLIEYVRVRNTRPYRESVGWGGQHLANALKYSTAFPVIVLSALMRNLPAPGEDNAVGADSGEVTTVGTGLYRAWLLAVMVNSLYSFYWDVAKDWDLTLFSAPRERASPEHAFGLRRRIMLGPPVLYYGVIGLDLLLRCTWSLKLSPHLDHLTDFESSIFLIEFLEVFRRWVWIFFRVETEWLRNVNTGGPAADDVLLSDFQGKYEDEE